MTETAIRRLHSQQIVQPWLQTPRDVVAWLGAIQGQDYPGAKWSLGLRLPGTTDAAVEAAIERREIVRTWAMRGTLHLVAAEDVHWLVRLTAPSMRGYYASRAQVMGLEAKAMARAYDLILGAMESGESVDRRTLLGLLEQHRFPGARERGRFYLHSASYEGLIVQGVVRANNPTFYRLDSLPDNKNYTRDEALAELARRYFTSRGPATAADFASWSALKMSDARAALDAAQNVLVSETLDGVTYWRSPDVAAGAAAQSTVYALPGFDEFLLGYKERSASLDRAHYEAWCPGGNGMFKPYIVSGGRVAGLWKRTIKRKTVVIEALPLRPLTEAERAGFEAHARHYAAFLGLEAVFAS